MRAGASDARVAHAALFERVLTRIHRYFRRMVRDPNEAEDCLQRTLVLLEESLVHGKYQPDRSFNTWMWLKARTVFAQWCRDRQRQPVGLADRDAEVPAPARSRETQEDSDRTHDAAVILERLQQELGDETYEAFVLYYEGGLTQAEIAEALDRDRKTVRKRIQEAHTLIDQILST